MDQQNTSRTSNDWRSERHAQMLENGIGKDVFFRVGKPGETELISAHKYMLYYMSSVFESQFIRFNETTGTQEGTEQKPIEVPDICPDAFNAMLKFGYAGDFSGVNKQNVMDVYGAGKKYMIEALVSECRQFLLNGENLGVDNVLAVLKHAQFHEDRLLIEHCWKFVENNPKAVIDSEDFLLLEEADLHEMFNRNFNWKIIKQKGYLLETGRGANIHFLVGKPGEQKELISCHKFILSSVIKDMCSAKFLRFWKFGRRSGGELTHECQPGTKEKPIEVTDVGPDAFRAMLRYIYTSELSGVTKQNVLDVYCAGKKYKLAALVKECRQLLLGAQQQDYLGVDNMFSVLTHAKRYEDKELINHCWTFVDKNMRNVVNFEEFLGLNETDLFWLLGRDTLEAEELFLFKNLHAWAIRKCEANGLKPTAENKQKVVGKIIYRIRFPLITRRHFTKHILKTEMLTKDDMLAMYVHYDKCDEDETKSKYPNRFNGHPRASAKAFPNIDTSKPVRPISSSRTLSDSSKKPHKRQRISDLAQ